MVLLEHGKLNFSLFTSGIKKRLLIYIYILFHYTHFYEITDELDVSTHTYTQWI